ncbi:MAG: hypothetical protein K8R85_16795 [Bacteroidetes bacterium]|nr:hypothetical protein [Bacteroidota bacterium]
MDFRIAVKHIWNKLRLYLSFLLFVFYLVIGILFLFTDTWINFLPEGRDIIGSVLISYSVLRLFIAYSRYKKKHSHIKTLSQKKKKQLTEKSQNVKTEAN